MTFVDTNYFLCFIIKDNSEQFKKAKELFLQAAQGEIELITSTLVFFEVSWVLISVYSKDRTALAKILLKTLSLNIIFENRDLLLSALDLFKKSNLSLIDCYNLSFCKQKQVKEFKTFDLQLSKQFFH